ncbi:N-acetyltransferase GCN5 [Streptococcus pseudoporcinus]|uniref:N-acetyltransferase GCN5 n=2 Tax=Streptococcus pseudoporcinus TaxID=361101 RepID=A0A4U9XH44_9STRE|nr:N-acetyltransferase GCN5 [Streptococcus pseudoporcinus]VUC64795.1 N-acetyltransferase GCN5 [Streptococcus pseudoporcinus]VUC95269.1 N-acetyltransferase GCN5 [Streptococcus pseudoporcinus]VUC95481.1 N-acetyltransferase GCN5 [Streptococcus pseudoporcinus]
MGHVTVFAEDADKTEGSFACMVVIRELDSSEVDRVAEIWLKMNKITHDYIDSSFWDKNLAEVRSQFLESEIYVAVDKQNICGFIGLTGEFVAGLFVETHYQSKGIGKQLLNTAKHYHTHLDLHVYSANQKAIKFYLSQGFEIDSVGVDASTNQKEYLLSW